MLAHWPRCDPGSPRARSLTSISSQLPGPAASPSSPEIRSPVILQAGALFRPSLPTPHDHLSSQVPVFPPLPHVMTTIQFIFPKHSRSPPGPGETTVTAPPGPGPCSQSSVWHSRPRHPRLCSCTSRDPDGGPHVSIQAPHPAESGSLLETSLCAGSPVHTAPPVKSNLLSGARRQHGSPSPQTATPPASLNPPVFLSVY